MKTYVEDGTVKSVILWNTNDLGYLTIQTANAVANGTLKPGDTKLAAGRLGEKEVRGDNVLLGKILVFTKDNIGQFNF
jgi:ABC-type sugar transport system substrate-binding protein